MANLDFSELLADPDFADTITVRRVAQSVGTNGRGITSESVFNNVVATVQPASARQVQLLPEAARVSETIQIHTMFEMRGPTATTQADNVLWRGRTFSVVSVNDFAHFGGGFYVVVASLQAFVDE